MHKILTVNIKKRVILKNMTQKNKHFIYLSASAVQVAPSFK